MREERRSVERFLEEIHEQTRAGEIRTAQRLVREAAAQYPEDPELREAYRILSDGRATPRPRTGRSLRDEYRWLKSPPAEFRGRWVALIGDRVVAVADTLRELRQSLPSRLEQAPLAVQIAS